jgi:hypothetical protein
MGFWEIKCTGCRMKNVGCANNFSRNIRLSFQVSCVSSSLIVMKNPTRTSKGVPLMKILFSLILFLHTLCLAAQNHNLAGTWTAHTILLRNHEIRLERKESLILKKDGSYIRKFSHYKSKGDSTQILFSTTFFNGKKTAVVKDNNGNILKPKNVTEKGKYKVDVPTRQLIFTTDDRTYFRDYTLDHRTMYLEETTDGFAKAAQTVYLLKLQRK